MQAPNLDNVPPDGSELLRAVFAKADILLWWGRVSRRGDEFDWNLQMAPECKHCALYKLAYASDLGGIWSRDQLPDLERTDKTAREALLSGASSYEHEFRVFAEHRTYWCNESVRITRAGPDVWSLIGVITDVSKPHADEEACELLHLDQVLERLDCMVWQCQVTDLGEGRLDWFFDIPPSGLMKRIFDREEGYRTKTIYKGLIVRQLAGMNHTAAHSIRSGASGYENEFQLEKPNGEVFWLHERVSIHSKGKGRWNLVGATVDVSARYMAESARKSAENQMQQILGRADCLLWQAQVLPGIEGPVWHMYVPPSVLYRKIFGHDPDPKMTSLWLPEFIPDLPRLNECSAAALLRGASFYEQEFKAFSGERIFWLNEHVTITGNAATGWNLVGVVTDVSDRREAEQALASEKERLAVTLRAMSEAVVSLDQNSRVVFMNRAASELSEWPLSDASGRQLFEVFHLEHAADRTVFLPQLDGILSAGGVCRLPLHIQLRGRAGRISFVEGSIVPLADRESRKVGAVFVLRDITERQHLEEQVQRAAKLESVGLLAGGIAHDFNNILTAIMGNLSLVQMDLDAEDELGSFLNDAVKACNRARDLTNQLLTFSKGGEPVRTAVSLRQLISEVAQFALTGSRVRSVYDIDPQLWPADADRGQISQVLQNLVINASQVMTEGGLLTISARNRVFGVDEHPVLESGAYIEIAVSDTGMGISSEHLVRIFDPYFTTKEQGHGLGLATVYSIVKRHRGFIEASSEQGRGACFRFWLPALLEVDHLAVVAPPASIVSEYQLRGRVLFMDDEEPIRRLAGRLLSRLGLGVVYATDGLEAVGLYREALLANQRFDLVILDLTVPGRVGGREAMSLLLGLDPRVRAIVSSGYCSDPIFANYEQHGFRGMVPKPYEVDALARVVRRVLEQCD